MPTLTLFQGEPGILGELKRYADGGGQILFGTDAGFLPDYDPTPEHELVAKAGLTWLQILTSLTTAPAERLGFGARSGAVVPGMDADLTVLDGDPAADVRTFGSVLYTIRGGRLVYRRSMPR